jgi:hypothetical protein
MKLSAITIAALSGYAAPVVANTEKAIFLGPRTSNMPTSHPNLDDLRVDILTPKHWTLRTHLEAEFPSAESKHGKSTWLVLDQLTEGQRYELRVCWAATVSYQPASCARSCPNLTTKVATHRLPHRRLRARPRVRDARADNRPLRLRLD